MEDLASVLRSLDDEFGEKERLSHGKVWCTPIPHDRKVSTVQEFYKAFHDTRTLPIHTCVNCYRKFGKAELEEVDWCQWVPFEKRHASQYSCRNCFPTGEKVLACAECVRELGKGALSPAAHLHSQLGCEHMFPDELKGLTPVEEKLIALNSCYGFITRYSIPGSRKPSTRYPKHVKGHITVFPNNLQELVADVLPHPLLKVMDDIHVSWQGPEKPTPNDLSVLLSVRRRVVEKALVWLKGHNSLYENIEIDVAEMESWGAPSHGVPSQVYERMERNEPSAWEKTRTAQLVPPTERGLEEERSMDIREVLAMLNQGEDVEVGGRAFEEPGSPGGEGSDEQMQVDGVSATVQEISSSGMFSLDAHPDIADMEKIRYLYDALGQHASWEQREESLRTGSAEVHRGHGSEPYIVISRGEDFADSFDARFFAKTFPTLFPFGGGGPRQAEESRAGVMGNMDTEAPIDEEATVGSILSSRNMSLERWVRLVLMRHGGRFATHHIFTFLVFNMLVRSRNRRVSMMSVVGKDFPEVERIVQSLSAQRLEMAERELETSGRTNDEAVNKLLRSLSLYGLWQPMSRELRMSMRRKIKSLIIRHGIPAIWFTLNPNDITNPVKLRLAAYRGREPKEAEAFLMNVDTAYKQVQLAISDPLSSALFFHREISMFFKHYVRVGDDSVFGRINEYFSAVETNERGALHLHGLLWLHGNMHLSSLLSDVGEIDQAAYRERVIEYVDSVFTEDLDQEAFCAVRAERRVTSDVSSLLQNRQQFEAAFDEEANFCAGATQIHTHSPTCVKYSISRQGRNRDLCWFKAPWRLVEKTSLTEDGLLKIRRGHSMVNRWNKAMAVGLRHNHDISFIATQRKTMAIVFYVTNYATKAEDPVWKRVAAATEVMKVLGDPVVRDHTETAHRSAEDNGGQNKTRQFLLRVANRIFTQRPLSQVEVIAHLLGYRTEFTNNDAWTFLNVSFLYWHIFRQWSHFQYSGGVETADQAVDEAVLLEKSGQRISFLQAYPHRGRLLQGLCLYDYMSVVKLKRKARDSNAAAWGEVQFERSWPLSQTWVQVLRKPGKHAVVCLDGYLSTDFNEEDGPCYRRAAVQHLAIFAPWESFLSETSGDINAIWEKQKKLLTPRVSFLAENIQLLRRSAEDAKRDARQWAALSGESESSVDTLEPSTGEGDEGSGSMYQSDDIANATRLIDVFRSTIGANQITAGSKEVAMVVRQLYRFQQVVLCSTDELRATVVLQGDSRAISNSGWPSTDADIPGQDKVRSIKSQQTSLSRERERMIQGIQEGFDDKTSNHNAAVNSVLNGFGEHDVQVTAVDSETPKKSSGPSLSIQFGPSTSFSEAGRQLANSFTLNQRQGIALRLLCLHWNERGTPQLCQFIRGEGGTGKSQIIKALIKLFASKGISHYLLVIVTSGTTATRISSITIYLACGFSIDTSHLGSKNGLDRFIIPSSAGLRINGQTRID
ncbi:hypothetical protein P154DRAFT_476817, partial [Amniculicola lignicola CBS 123094]